MRTNLIFSLLGFAGSIVLAILATYIHQMKVGFGRLRLFLSLPQSAFWSNQWCPLGYLGIGGGGRR
jgi:hypothetical protein